MRYLMLILVACLFGCGSRTGFESSAGAGGADTTTTATEDPTTITASETITTTSCALAAPDLMPVLPAPEDVAGVVVQPLPAFDVPTVCETVVAGLYLNDDVLPCETPADVDLEVFDVASLDGLAPPPGMPSYYTIALPPQSEWAPTANPGTYEVRFHLPTSHGVGQIPLVGATVRPNLCPVTLGCVAPAVRYRVSGEWSVLWMGLLFGLEDCAPAQ